MTSLNKFIFYLLIFSTHLSFAKDKTINLKKLSSKVFVYESFLETEQWGKVSCNGMVFINNGEALVFDTPASEDASKVLIDLIQDSLKVKIVGVVINHFHEDCLGGLNTFHYLGIPSYANRRTIMMARSNGFAVPQNGFQKRLILKAGREKVQNFYFGPAHTKDNIVSYIPSEKLLFGGCMVKALGASKGNLFDADTSKWSKTITNVIKLKPTVVIPGHGEIGGTELLRYTEKLFKN
jgi:metallo-beta-lactamase class B